MTAKMIKDGLKYAIENFRKPIFVHSKDLSILDDVKEELCEVEALHIIPASCAQNKEYIKDFILVVDSSNINCDLRKCKNVILNVKKSEIENLNSMVSVLLQEVDRININILDVDKNFDLEKYEHSLKEISNTIVGIIEEKNKMKEVNILTDILFMNRHGGCKAGQDSITYAPDGMRYICPAFYKERKEPIGTLFDKENIKNEHLLSDEFAPLCNNCDAFHCENCKFINFVSTGEINVSPAFQCKKAHVERKISYYLQNELKKHIDIQNVLTEIDYDDPYKILEVNGKNMGFYNC